MSARWRRPGWPGSRARAPCTSASAATRSTRCGSTSTSRRGSSRRSCAAAPTASRRTSPSQDLRHLPGRLPDERVPGHRGRLRRAVDGPIAALRRLLYCGEWIASHALHIYMLHAPDFLGYPGAVELARDHRDLVERGLALRRAGNAIMETIGGRAVHPVNVQVGGFYSVPGRRRSRRRSPASCARALDAGAGRRCGGWPASTSPSFTCRPRDAGAAAARPLPDRGRHRW